VAITRWVLWDSKKGLAIPSISETLISLALGYTSLLIIVFFWKVLTAPLRLDKKEKEARKRAESEAEKLHKEIAAAQADNTGLAIIFDRKDQTQGVGRIAVKNRSLKKSVTTVEVWVTEITAKLQQNTLASRAHRKDLHRDFRADILHPSCSELFDIFQWDENSNVHLCIEKPHGPSFKLKDLPNAQCELDLEARANDLPTVPTRFMLKWNGKEVECHELVKRVSSGAFRSADDIRPGHSEFGGERLDFSDSQLRPGIDF
jgi:hypothetical protein